MIDRVGRVLILIPFLAAGFGASPAGASEDGPDRLRFSVTEGRVHNEFLREGPVAAHVVLSDGAAPRLVVAFPAGNSGTALWFSAAQPVRWARDVSLATARREVPGGILHGVTADLAMLGAPVTIRHAILSSVRVIRDYGYTGETPPEILASPQRSERRITWHRRRLDGAPGYDLTVELRSGNIRDGADGRIELHPDGQGNLRLRVTALTGEPPLAPIPGNGLLNAAAKPDARLRDALRFLSYEGKLLAGSWRFNTYFGRDTLMSVELLMPVLDPTVVEAGLGAVLDRLDAAGEVAHEEDIGEYAVLRRVRRGEAASDTPIYDYKMIDDDFLLSIVAADYLLATPAGRARAAAFLSRTTPAGEPYGAALYRNCRFVVAAASPFAHEAGWRNLIRLKPGETVGNWRDSEAGLGGGVYPYDVNAVFVPAALRATARLRDSGLLRAYAGDDAAAAAPVVAERMADVWLASAPALFAVRLESATARDEIERYARRIGVDAAPALAALGDSPVVFSAVALDDRGLPVPVLNSDEGFALLFLNPPADDVRRIATTLMRPFPAGLMTDVGPVVANPAYGGAALEAMFERTRYHGTVIWAWQQSLLAAGIARQFARTDLDEPARRSLQQAHARLAGVMEASRRVRGSELWSWSHDDGRYRVAPFGQQSGDETESNAAQLWSTIQLVPLAPLSQPAGR